jgi:hypothetical protein
MIILREKETGEIERQYECTPEASIELCFANIECLLHIALADPDDHIRELGGESELLNLMNRYMSLAQCLRDWEMEDEKLHKLRWEKICKSLTEEDESDG